MKINQIYPLLLAVLMYGGATYLTFLIYFDKDLKQYPDGTTLLSTLGMIASYLYLSGSILLIGFYISNKLRKT